MSDSKLLSIIVVGRNDDYLGNYRYRLQTSLNHLAKNLRSLGRLGDVEVVFVDWNSQGKPLSDEVELSTDAASLVRFVIVTPNDAKRRFMQVAFFTTCAVNVGVRRATGQFIMLADSDSIMPAQSLASLLKVLDGSLPAFGPKERLIYPIPRHQIPGAISARRPNVAAWDIVLQRISASRRKELPAADCLGGFSAGQLMHRDMWFEFGGYNETLDRAWGWSDNELMLRVTQKYNWMDLGYYGVVAFHIEHHASTGNSHQRDPNSINAMLLTYDPHPNPPDWGLRDYELAERRCSGQGRPSQTPEWSPLSYQVSVSSDVVGSVVDDFVSWTALMHDKDAPFNQTTRDAIGIAFSFATYEFPRNAFFFGDIRLPLLTILTKLHPGIEYFFLQPWKQGDLAGTQTTPGALGSHLSANGHRGFARIVSGPAVPGMKDLIASDPHIGPIELAIVERASFDDNFELVLATVLNHLAPGGGVILVDERRRSPTDLADMRVFLGRILARGDQKQADTYPGRVFQQAEDEAERGAAFDVATTPSGSAHLIRRRFETAKTLVRMAAE
ncbi:MAG: hypothetical protein Q8R44_10770 [Novosphingobium sp.]|nr:hypothetical protein [Novosphingobium sp.]